MLIAITNAARTQTIHLLSLNSLVMLKLKLQGQGKSRLIFENFRCVLVVHSSPKYRRAKSETIAKFQPIYTSLMYAIKTS